MRNSTPKTDAPRGKVAILGASNNRQRYAWLAQQSLKEHDYAVVPISVKYGEVDGIPAYKALTDVPDRVDTVTVYLNPAHLADFVDQIIAVKPRRVIFNPGSEDAAVAARLRQAGIEVEMACTLVLLRTQQF